MYTYLDFHAEGASPLLLHNGNLADPRNPYSRAKKSAARDKSDAGVEEVARLEFLGGLYYKSDLGVYIPGYNVWSGLYSAAKRLKLGKVAKAAVIVEDDAALSYDGPRTPDALWEDGGFHMTREIKQQQVRIMRTRPMFPTPWSFDFRVGYLDDIDRDRVIEIAEIFGRLEGVGDWRPVYGRMVVSVK